MPSPSGEGFAESNHRRGRTRRVTKYAHIGPFPGRYGGPMWASAPTEVQESRCKSASSFQQIRIWRDAFPLGGRLCGESDKSRFLDLPNKKPWPLARPGPFVFPVARSGCPLRALVCVGSVAAGGRRPLMPRERVCSKERSAYSASALPCRVRYIHRTTVSRRQSDLPLNIPSAPLSMPFS